MRLQAIYFLSQEIKNKNSTQHQHFESSIPHKKQRKIGAGLNCRCFDAFSMKYSTHNCDFQSSCLFLRSGLNLSNLAPNCFSWQLWIESLSWTWYFGLTATIKSKSQWHQCNNKQRTTFCVLSLWTHSLREIIDSSGCSLCVQTACKKSLVVRAARSACKQLARNHW